MQDNSELLLGIRAGAALKADFTERGCDHKSDDDDSRRGGRMAERPSRRIALGIGFASWFFCAHLPALATAATQSQGDSENHYRLLWSLFGNDAAAYLSLCPSPLVAYVLPLLVTGPMILWVFVLDIVSPMKATNPRAVARMVLRVIAYWGSLQIVGLSTVVGMQVVYGHGRSSISLLGLSS